MRSHFDAALVRMHDATFGRDGRGVLAGGSTSLALLHAAIATPGAPCVFVFAESAGWMFYGDEHRQAEPEIREALANNEALAYRDGDGYEHAALIDELLRRMRISLMRRCE